MAAGFIGSARKRPEEETHESHADRLGDVPLLRCAGLCAAAIDFAKLEITTTDLGHGVYLLNWKGGDSVVLTGADGALLVDDYLAPLYDKLVAAIAKVSGKPVKYVLNAHAHADHFGGNEALRKPAPSSSRRKMSARRMENGWYIASFNQIVPPQTPAALPTITYAEKMTINFDGETIDLIHAPAAHTDSDSIIYFRKANVIHIGGRAVERAYYPIYDISTGGSLAGVIKSYETVLGPGRRQYAAHHRRRRARNQSRPASRARQC